MRTNLKPAHHKSETWFVHWLLSVAFRIPQGPWGEWIPKHGPLVWWSPSTWTLSQNMDLESKSDSISSMVHINQKDSKLSSKTNHFPPVMLYHVHHTTFGASWTTVGPWGILDPEPYTARQSFMCHHPVRVPCLCQNQWHSLVKSSWLVWKYWTVPFW